MNSKLAAHSSIRGWAHLFLTPIYLQVCTNISILTYICRASSHLYSGSNQLSDEWSSANICGSSGHYASTSTSLSHVSANNTKVSRLLCSTVLRVYYFPIYFIRSIESASIFNITSKALPLRRTTENLIKDHQNIHGVYE